MKPKWGIRVKTPEGWSPKYQKLWLRYEPDFNGLWHPFFLTSGDGHYPPLGFASEGEAKNWLIALALLEPALQELESKVRRLPPGIPVQPAKSLKGV